MTTPRAPRQDLVLGIYDAVLDPGKLDLLRAWVRRQDWFDGDPESLQQVTAYRFVDPDGEVGMESFLLSDGSQTYHVPVTYRGAELSDAADALAIAICHARHLQSRSLRIKVVA